MSPLPVVLLVTWAAAIAYFDLRFRRIPNVLSLGACLVAAVVMTVNRASFTGAEVTSGLWGAGFGLLVTLPAYLMRRLGAGDVKYMAAIGLLTSLPTTLACFIYTGLAGGIVILWWLYVPKLAESLPVAQRQALPRLAAYAEIPLRQRRMAYGALMSLGLCAELWARY